MLGWYDSELFGCPIAQVMQAYAEVFPHLANAAQVIVSSASDGARFLDVN